MSETSDARPSSPQSNTAASRQLHLTKFRNVSLADPFFDSLKASYGGFPEWFESKSDEDLYVVKDDGRLSGMIYLKAEIGAVADVQPPLPAARWMKVGTLKIEGRGTKLGERVLKKILDTAIAEKMDGIYITVFELHDDLVRLFERYGFGRHGTKTGPDGTELVLCRRLDEFSGDLVADYPFVRLADCKVWLLAVYPEFHTRLLPDSILNNEPREIVKDVSHTNTIHKVYIGRLPLNKMSRGDIIVIYRTTDHQGPAFYRSVATSICVVEDVRAKEDFPTPQSFVSYAAPHSVFSESELLNQFVRNNQLYIVRMTYNAAFGARVTRGRLLEEVGVSEQPRWDFRELTRSQLRAILKMGKVDARLIVD